MSTIIKAILKINPNAEVSVSGDDINSIVWENGTTPIPVADIEAKMAELQTKYDNKQYQRDRAKAYPSLEEQMDMQYWDKVNGTNNWETKIAEIKAQFPKPTT
jgi:hypothetical protein